MPAYSRWSSEELLLTFCCLRQLERSLSRGFGFQDEIRAFIGERQDDYTRAETIVAEKAHDLPTEAATPFVATLPLLVMRGVNRLRQNGFLVDEATTRLLKFCFDRLQTFQAASGSDIAPAVAFRADFYYATWLLRRVVGDQWYKRAYYIETFHQPQFFRHYTFEEIRQSLRPRPYDKKS